MALDKSDLRDLTASLVSAINEAFRNIPNSGASDLFTGAPSRTRYGGYSDGITIGAGGYTKAGKFRAGIGDIPGAFDKIRYSDETESETADRLSKAEQKKLTALEEEYAKVIEDMINSGKRQATINAKLEEFSTKRNEQLGRINDAEKTLADARKKEADLAKKTQKQKEQEQKRTDADTAKQKAKQMSILNLGKKGAALTKAGEAKQDWAREILADPDASTADKEAAKSAMNASAGTVMLGNILTSVSNAMSKVASKMSNALDEDIELISGYQKSVMARLQIDKEAYDESIGLVSSNIGGSPYVSQKKVLENLSTLVDKGVAENIELRAFLQTVKESIATTFNAFDSNLLRLIRLQQTDLTASRLGLEARLTEVLTGMYKDSSYLSDAFDNVSEKLLEASAIMSVDQSTQFEYIVQKWLGSLYSVGASSDTVNTLAQGIAYLATGDVESLAGNSSLQTLLLKGASRGGLSYEDLIGDLSPDETNKLLRGVIEYLQEIATNTNTNTIVKKAYSNVLGVSLSDLQAVTSITEDELNTLSSELMTYESTLGSLEYQLGQVGERTSFSEQVRNATDNVMMSTAQGIADSGFAYALWYLASQVEDLTGGTHLPSFGFVDLSAFTVEGLLKAGVAGVSLIANLSSIIGGLSGDNLSMSTWASDIDWDKLMHGEVPTTNRRVSIGSGTSQSQYIGGGTSDMKSGALTEAANDEEVKTVSDSVSEESASVETLVKLMQAVYDEDGRYLRVMVVNDNLPIVVDSFSTEAEMRLRSVKSY